MPLICLSFGFREIPFGLAVGGCEVGEGRGWVGGEEQF